MRDIYKQASEIDKARRAELHRVRMLHRQGLIDTREFDAKRATINMDAERESAALMQAFLRSK